MNPIKLTLSILATVLALVTVLSSCSVIKPGESGVIFNRVTGSMHTAEQGAVFTPPFIVSVQAYPTSLRTYSMVMRQGEGSDHTDDSIDLPSKEGQHIRQDISITYNTTHDKAAEVYKAFKGEDVAGIEATFIRRTTITVAQNIAGSMSLTELISTRRDELQSAIQTKLHDELLKMGFTIDKVNLGAAHLPASVETQMQQKMAAQQDAQRAEYELVKQGTLAKARVAEAEGVAKANAIIQNSLTSAILENKRIEKWNGVLPQVSGATGGLMLNLNRKE